MRLKRMPGGVADVVAVEGNGGELGEASQKLLARDGWPAGRGGARHDAEERIGHLPGELGTEREGGDGKLIEVGVRHAKAGELAARVAERGAPIAGDGFL